MYGATVDWICATRQRATIFAVTVVALLVAVSILWQILSSPLHGVVSATVIATDGSVRAIAVTVKDLSSHYYSFPQDLHTSLVAAVPSPNGDSLAYVTRTRDGSLHVSVGDVGSVRPKEILDGSVGVPRWSEEGTSIAVAKQDKDSLAPEAWTVFRAVKQGDSLTVGQGFKPFPSRNQRTFALTSEGIALLSYSDTAPNIAVASPVPVPVTTPFAVSQDGVRVAWVAPADHSLQVFENVNGYFVPLHLSKASTLQTLVFSPDGRYILGGTYSEATTTLELIKISSGAKSIVGTVAGIVDMHTWRYEK